MNKSLAFASLVLSLGLGAVFGCSGTESTPNSFVGKGSTSTDPTDPANQDDGSQDPGTTSSSGTTGSSSGTSTSSSSSGGSSGTSTSSSSTSSSGGSSGASDPLNAAAKCTNGTSTAGSGSYMRPGYACNQCHNFSVAGTVYPSGHEPNNCKGVNVTGMKVVVTDSSGQSYNVTVNSAGNFYSNSNFSFPINVKVVDSTGKSRSMTTDLNDGDCNSCHTQNGSGSPKAPGRITAPF